MSLQNDELHQITPAIERDAAYWIERHWRRKHRRKASGVGAARKVQQEGRCRLCKTTEAERRRDRTETRPSRYKLTKHHLVPVSLGGTNAIANIVPLCRACHDLIDKMPLWKRIPKRAELRLLLHPDEIAHVVSRLGRDWFDWHYPEDPNAWIGATVPAE